MKTFHNQTKVRLCSTGLWLKGEVLEWNKGCGEMLLFTVPDILFSPEYRYLRTPGTRRSGVRSLFVFAPGAE